MALPEAYVRLSPMSLEPCKRISKGEAQVDWFELGIPKGLFRYRMALLGLFVSYLLVAGYYCNNGIMNPDEGFYALAAKEAMSGAIPYRDFGYSQAPLLPYLNGALMKWIGFGWLEQRWVNALWGLATLVLLAYGGARVGQPWLRLLGITALIVSPFWIHYTCMGKTSCASGFWLSLSTLAAVLPGRSQGRMWAFSISTAIAVGCRLTVLPGVCFMVIALAARFTGIRRKIRGRRIVWDLPYRGFSSVLSDGARKFPILEYPISFGINI